MESRIDAIVLEDGRRIFVEVTPADGPPAITGRRSSPALPDGAEPTELGEDLADAARLLRDQIAAIAETVHRSLEVHRPDELAVEITIGFKGKTNPIPVILGAEASGGIKITAKWRPKEGA